MYFKINYFKSYKLHVFISIVFILHDCSNVKLHGKTTDRFCPSFIYHYFI